MKTSVVTQFPEDGGGKKKS